MHYTTQELAELKKAMKPTQQAQIPMPNIPKKRGGAGRGQGRKPIHGEKKQSKVIRVPLDKLNAVNDLLALDTDECNSIIAVIKSWRSSDSVIDKVNQPTPVPITDIKPHHRKVKMKYAMTINGINHYWSGRGRMPKAFNDYVYDHNNGVMISYNEREEFFKRFLIEENKQ